MQTKLSVSVNTLIVDAVIIALFCVTPAIMHLFGLSYHYFEPMRIALFAGMLIVGNHKNSYLLAAVLPISSMILSGMPTPIICALMVVELLLNVKLFYWLTKLGKNAIAGMLVSIIVSKVVFRLLKCLCVSSIAFNSANLMANWQSQLIMSIVLACGFGLLLKINEKNNVGR